MASESSDLEGGQIADDQAEDEYGTVRWQRTEKCARISSQQLVSVEV